MCVLAEKDKSKTNIYVSKYLDCIQRLRKAVASKDRASLEVVQRIASKGDFLAAQSGVILAYRRVAMCCGSRADGS